MAAANSEQSSQPATAESHSGNGEMLANARILFENQNTTLRDMHSGNQYSAQRDINQYFANRDLFEQGTDEQRRTALFNALNYAGANAKREQLDLTEIGPDSFTWIKSTSLFEWLRSGTTPFWITGKPASGKSTLMRFLSDSDSVQQQLRSDGRRWKIVHFFFDFRAGKDDANHIRGALKSFLQQLARMDGDVAKFALKPENDRVIKQSPADVHI